MIDCNTRECKDHAVLTYPSYSSTLDTENYKRYYCATCYIKLKGWTYERSDQ